MAFWKKLGKVALKVAPYAAAFIPGVGPVASMAIAGAANAASKKLEGGTWKQALGAGALGAGTSALMSGIGGQWGGGKSIWTGKPTTSGLLPSKNIGSAAFQSLPDAAGKSSALAGSFGKALASNVAKSGGMSALGKLGTGIQLGSTALGALGSLRGGGDNGQGSDFMPYQGALNSQFSPNLADSINAGQRNAIRNQQSFRGGQAPFTFLNEETGLQEDMPGGGIPPIFSGGRMAGGGGFSGRMGRMMEQPQYQPMGNPEEELYRRAARR